MSIPPRQNEELQLGDASQGISTSESGWQLRVLGGIKTVFQGWLFSKGQQRWVLQRGLLEEERGWDLRVPPPS